MPLNLRRLQAFRAGLSDALDRGAHEAGVQVLDLAKQLCPVDQGDLQSTGRLIPEQPDGSRSVSVVFGGASGPHKFVDYAAYVEYGTSQSAAQPFLTPAAHAIDVTASMAAAIKRLQQESGF